MTIPAFYYYHTDQLTALTGTPEGGSYATGGPGSRPGFQVNGTESVEWDLSSASASELWLTTACYTFGGAGDDIITFKGPTSDLLKIDYVGGLGMSYWDGSAWQLIGSRDTTTTFVNAEVRFDVRCHIDGSAGNFEFYVNNSLVSSTTGDTLHTADTTIDNVVLEHSSGVTGRYHIFADLMVDTADTRGLYMEEMLPTSNGTNTDWVGSETDIDETMNGVNLANYIEGQADGDVETFNMTAVDAGYSGYSVEGVAVLTTAQAVASPGLHLEGHLYKSATGYDSDNSDQPAASTWARYALEFENDPATAAAWASIAAVDAYEFGLKVSTTP